MKITTREAVKTLTEALKNDHELFFSYQSNIAMSFVDEYNDYKKLRDKEINKIANAAAINFLNMWIKSGSA